MKNRITKHKWFWAWDDEKEEAWLSQMAAEGWHLCDFAPFGFYTFEDGPARNVIYRLDFQYQTHKHDRQDYLQLFADAGWEHVGQLSNWQYFRREVKPGEQPQLFTDVESKLQKYGRVTVILVVCLPILLQLPLRLSNAVHESDWYAIPLFLVFCLLLVYIYAMLQLIRRISQLKKSQKLKQ